jgi:nicotinamidase-related amidase
MDEDVPKEDVPKVDAARTALVLMDFQPAMLGAVTESGTAALLANAERALTWARSTGLTVAHVRVAFRDADYAAIPDRNRAFAPLRGGGIMADGSPECEIVEPLRPQRDEIVVRKIRFGSFSTTSLSPRLREAGIESLILAGITTSGVVLSTVRDAADQDFQMYVLADACADSNPHVHSLLTETVFPHQAYVMSTAQLGQLI